MKGGRVLVLLAAAAALLAGVAWVVRRPVGTREVAPTAPAAAVAPRRPPERPALVEPMLSIPTGADARPHVKTPAVAEPTVSIAERRRRADEATGLTPEELKQFHADFMKGLASFGPTHIDPSSMESLRDAAMEGRIRAEVVAEELLGPERGRAYIDAVLGPRTKTGPERERLIEKTKRYLEQLQNGLDPPAAARAAGIIGEEDERALAVDAGPR